MFIVLFQSQVRTVVYKISSREKPYTVDANNKGIDQTHPLILLPGKFFLFDLWFNVPFNSYSNVKTVS